jgi:hypothetical protein
LRFYHAIIPRFDRGICILKRYPWLICSALVLIISILFVFELAWIGMIPAGNFRWLPLCIPIVTATLFTTLMFKKIKNSLIAGPSKIVMFGWAELILYVSILAMLVALFIDLTIAGFFKSLLFILVFSYFAMLYANVILLPQIIILIFIIKRPLKTILG